MSVSPRTTAICAVAGGAAWTLACLHRATLPRGCVGAECFERPMRESSAVGSVLLLAGVALLVAAAVGLLTEVRRRGGLGWAGRVGGAVGAVGVGLVATGLIAAAVAGDIDWMPYVLLPGVALVAAALVVAAVVLLRSRVVAWWAGAGLVVGSALGLLANEQTAAVVLGAPFGLAWIAVGVSLARSARGPTGAQPAGARSREGVPT